MKLAVHLPVLGRPRITELAFRSLTRVLEEFREAGVESRVLVIGSEQRLKRLAHKYNFDWFECENKPLGKKFDLGLKELLKDKTWTHLFEMCSDNVFEQTFVEKVLEAQKHEPDLLGLVSFYMMNWKTKKVRLFETGAMSNVGRITKRKFIERVIRRRNYVFEYRLRQGLDASFYKAVCNVGKAQPTALRNATPLVVDLKSGESMHSFESFERNPQKFKVVNLGGHFEEITPNTKENGNNGKNSE